MFCNICANQALILQLIWCQELEFHEEEKTRNKKVRFLIVSADMFA